jgi:Tfp pilus assembly protein PilF
MKSPRQALLESYIDENPSDPFTHYALALELLKNGNPDEAQAKFEWLLQNHPDYLATYYQLGDLYQKMNKLNLAKDVYKKGMLVAAAQKNNHIFNEIKSALEEMEDND